MALLAGRRQVPHQLTISNEAADSEVRRVAGDAEPFGLLLVTLLDRLTSVYGDPYSSFLVASCDVALVEAPPLGETSLLREAVRRDREAHVVAFERVVKPELEQSKRRSLAAATAWQYVCARRLIETRGFQIGEVRRALVPCADLVNFARDGSLSLVANACAWTLVAARDIEAGEEVLWDYATMSAPLVVLAQYGVFLDEASTHAVPLEAPSCLDIGCEDRLARRRRAAVTVCLNLDRTPFECATHTSPGQTIYWLDCTRPDSAFLDAPLVLALRAALAPDDEVLQRDRTAEAWAEPLPASDEVCVLHCLRDLVVARKTLCEALDDANDCSLGARVRRYEKARLGDLLLNVDRHLGMLKSRLSAG